MTTSKQYHYVYKTVCITTGHFYYGIHSTNNLNDSYIGSGIKFLNYVRKYGWENFSKQIVQFVPTRELAFEIEKTLLTEAILKDKMCLNLIEGGRGDKHNYDESFKDRISSTRKIRIEQGKIIPTKHTEEHRAKLRQHNPGGKATAREIYQICKETGKVLQLWNSSRNAGIQLNIKTWRNISHSASKLKTQSVGGFFWRWKDDPDIVNDYLVTIEELKANIAAPRNPYGVKGKSRFDFLAQK